MARTATLTQLLTDIRYQASIQGLTVRHDDTSLTRLINQSIQAHRAAVSASGLENYLVSHSSTFTAGNTSPYKFGVLDLSSGPSPAVVRVYGVDVIVDGNEQKTLHPVTFSERSDYGGTPAEPEAWAPFQSYKVAIFPAPVRAYTYIAWYLPKLADLATGSDTWDGVEGWEQVVIWDVVCKIFDRDQFPQAYQLATAERARAENTVMLTAKNPGRGVVRRRRDTWAERRFDRLVRRQPWRWP